MPLWEQFTRPNTLGSTRTNTPADKREIDTGTIMQRRVREAYYAHSLMEPMFHHRREMLQNTGTAEARGVGTATIQKMDDDQADGPPPTETKIGQNRIHVDTEVVARNELKNLARLQSNIVAMESKIYKAQGMAMARFVDQAYMIQAIKAGMSTSTAYRGLSATERYFGGTQHQLPNEQALTNPVALRDAILDLQAKIEDEKELVLAGGDYTVFLRPLVWNALAKLEQAHDRNMDYSDGFSYKGRVIYIGEVAVVSCAWLPTQRNITNHHLSNASNGNAFDGNFTKVVGVLVGPDALFDGWNIDVYTDMEENKKRHSRWYETSCAFTVGIDDAKHAGVLTLP